jgi:thiamine kinase-like enzyme
VLRAADQDLVVRDPAVPGLAVLLDEEALGRWLSEQMQESVRVRVHYLRYKHATSCVLAGDVDVADSVRACLVAAYAHPDHVKATKTLQRAPAGSVLGVDPALGLLATTSAADRDLPALALLDDDVSRRRLLRRVLGDRPGLRHATVRALRHNPHRRWVGIVQPRQGPAAVLRCYRPARARAATEAIAAWAGGEPRTPRLLGVHPRRGVAAVDFMPGRLLSQGTVADFLAAGRALARLHCRREVVLRTSGPVAEARAVRASAGLLSVLLPDMAEDLDDLAGVLGNRLVAMEHVRRPIHGDFSADQVVVGDRAVGLIDLDSARLADPAVDLACASASMTLDVVLGQLDCTTAEQQMGALHEGYALVGDVPGEARLATHEAAHLLRRAVKPFRLRMTPEWPSASRDLVERARNRLSGTTLVGGAR